MLFSCRAVRFFNKKTWLERLLAPPKQSVFVPTSQRKRLLKKCRSVVLGVNGRKLARLNLRNCLARYDVGDIKRRRRCSRKKTGRTNKADRD